MAGEWIKMRTNLWSDPRVSQMCDLTDKSKAAIVGALYWLWASADEHTQTGHMPGLSTKGIDRDTGIKGFGAALVVIGWVEDTPGGITLIRFSEHNGASAKTRATTAKRVANHTAKGKNDDSANDELTPHAEKTNGASVSLPLAREEKNREELNTTTPIPPDGGNAPPEAKPAKAGAIALQTFLADCNAKGERPLRGYAPLWTYAKEAGIESDFVALAWAEFRRRFTPGGQQPEKRQKDWRATFRKYVENNYFKLWAIDKDGKYFLTSQGKQAQKVFETRESA